MEAIDSGVDSTILIEAEIEILMHRLAGIDPDAILRIELLLKKLRETIIVEHEFH